MKLTTTGAALSRTSHQQALDTGPDLETESTQPVDLTALDALEVKIPDSLRRVAPLRSAIQAYLQMEGIQAKVEQRIAKIEADMKQRSSSKPKKALNGMNNFMRRGKMSGDYGCISSAVGVLAGVAAGIATGLAQRDVAAGFLVGTPVASSVPATWASSVMGEKGVKKKEARHLKKLALREPELAEFAKAFATGTPPQKACLSLLATKWLAQEAHWSPDARTLLSRISREEPEPTLYQAAWQAETLLQTRFASFPSPSKQISNFLYTFKVLDSTERVLIRPILFERIFQEGKPTICPMSPWPACTKRWRIRRRRRPVRQAHASSHRLNSPPMSGNPAWLNC